MLKTTTTIALSAMLALLATVGSQAQEFSVDWYTVDAGGETSTTGGDFELSGTIGQPDANTTVLTGGDFELAAGFWPGIGGFCFGDLNGDGAIGIADLAQLLGSYGETGGVSYYDGDLDGDGDVDLADLAELLGRYGETCW